MRQCVDIETYLIADGQPAPKLVCLSWSDGNASKLLVPWEGESPYALVERILRDKSVTLINQHIVYDLGILCVEHPPLLPLVFQALEEGRIRCLKVREQLIRISLGEAKYIDVADDEEPDEELKLTKTRFDLKSIARRWLGIELQKEGTWRTSYSLLDGVPLAQWEPEAVEYPLKDARIPLQVWDRTEAFIQSRPDLYPNGELPTEVAQNCANWALHLMKMWGIRCNPEAVAELRKDLEKKVEGTTKQLLKLGIMRMGGTKKAPKAVTTTKVVQSKVIAAYKALGESVPMTPASKKFPEGQVKTSKLVLKNSKDSALVILAEHKGYTKILSTYIPRYLERGITVPINADWNVLVESARISCSSPNLTNPPRAGKVRECIEARGLFLGADFDQAELRSWAEICLHMFGYSTLAEAFREGVDPHLKLAAQLLGLTLDETMRRYADGDKEVEERRQFCKEPNFGYIGGLGAKKFSERAAEKEIDISIGEAKQIRNVWMSTWPEAKEYLDYFAQNHDEPRTLIHPITGFVRGDCGYTDGANHLFQHLTAMGVKQSLWRLSKECHLDRDSPLYGTHPVLDLHDELIGDTPECGTTHEAAMRWGQLMTEGMQTVIKNVPVKCTPVLTRRLYKGAKPVYVNGRLVPSKPEYIVVGVDENGKDKVKTKWVADL